MAKPRIVIDARMVTEKGHGISTFVVEMAHGLAGQADLEIIYLVQPALPAAHFLRRFPTAESSIPFLHPREIFFLAKEIAALNPSLYYSPSFSSLYSYPCKHIQTIHDLNHLRYGSFAQKLYYRWILKRSLQTAAAVTVVSNFAAQELQQWISLASPALFTPNAIVQEPPANFDTLTKKFGVEAKKFFLLVSNEKPHKNTKLLLAAYGKARTKIPLVVSFSCQSQEGIVPCTGFSAAELSALYANAKTVFFPSLYEGQGLPPLEAAASGTVPVVSDIPPHREGLADIPEAEFLSPADEAAWTRAFEKWSALTAAVSEKSRARLTERFSRERLTNGVLEAIRRGLRY